MGRPNHTPITPNHLPYTVIAKSDLGLWIQEQQPSETRIPLGRRRVWENTPKITELLNSPIQGTSADITKKALTLLPQALEGTRAKIIGCVHDEILLEAPIETEDEVGLILKKTMELAGREFLEKVPVVVEVVGARSWVKKY